MNILDAMCDVVVRAFGGYTLADMQGLENYYVGELDRKRQAYERMIGYLQDVDRRVLDIHDRKRIAYSVPDKDWNVASMKATVNDLTSRIDDLAHEAEQRRHVPDVAEQNIVQLFAVR